MPTPSDHNHASAMQHPRDVTAYVLIEIEEGEILGPFDLEPFVPWCQDNALLTRPKKDSHLRRVIIDLSLPTPPGVIINACTTKDRYMGDCKKMALPTAADLISLIMETSKGCYLNSCDICSEYRQLPLDPCDWSLVCLKVQGHYFVDLSLPFGLRWAASCCQDTTSFINRALREQVGMVLNYNGDFEGVVTYHHTATQHFYMLQSLLQCLDLKGAVHKASPPAQAMTWLSIHFDTVEMSVTIKQKKLNDTLWLVKDWGSRKAANINQLRALLGKLLPIAQCCHSTRLFLTCMLSTLRNWPR